MDSIRSPSDDVLLALKVEVYGMADYEDPHAQDLAKPEGTSPFCVVKMFHDNTCKIMIGSIKCLTFCTVMLTDGTVVVGPGNKIFEPKRNSCVWIKKDPGLLFLILRTLYGLKIKHGWSGIKVAAFVFHQLFTRNKIVKVDMLENANQALELRKGVSCVILKTIQEMTSVMKDVEVFPVSDLVNTCLTDLAGNLSSEITTLNHTVVLGAVVKKIKSMVPDSE
ncbi:hypothetical protein EDD11_008214 [Mortierella claussenii]|nr:hypothetical protein EDD11_008214 [Mortierella claussenii]